MIVPNKVVPISETALSIAPKILAQGPSAIGVEELFRKLERQVEGLDQFMLALDLLYIIGRIDVDLAEGTVSYVD